MTGWTVEDTRHAPMRPIAWFANREQAEAWALEHCTARDDEDDTYRAPLGSPGDYSVITAGHPVTDDLVAARRELALVRRRLDETEQELSWAERSAETTQDELDDARRELRRIREAVKGAVLT
jgi:hypothetical protein